MLQHDGHAKLWLQEWASGDRVRMSMVCGDRLDLRYYTKLERLTTSTLEVISKRLLYCVEAFAHGADHPNVECEALCWNEVCDGFGPS